MPLLIPSLFLICLKLKHFSTFEYIFLLHTPLFAMSLQPCSRCPTRYLGRDENPAQGLLWLGYNYRHQKGTKREREGCAVSELFYPDLCPLLLDIVFCLLVCKGEDLLTKKVYVWKTTSSNFLGPSLHFIYWNAKLAIASTLFSSSLY